MKSTLFPAIATALLLALVGCDSNDDSSGPEGIRFSVLYEATGTFTEPCNMVYITRQDDVGPDQQNEGGQSITVPETLPWSHSFDVTVTQLRPFNLFVAAVCGGGSSTDEVEVNLYVGGVKLGTDTQTGGVVNAQAEYTLTIEE